MIVVSVPASPLPTVDVELGQEQLLGYYSLVPSRVPPVD